MAPLLEVRGLVKRFAGERGREVQAVAGVDLHLNRGETLGVVGESGCGKSTLARCIVRLEQPTAGTVRYDGTEITELSNAALRPFRRRMQIVFQDPVASLNPRLTVRDTLREPLLVHRMTAKEAVDGRVVALLEQVGLGEEILDRFPHALSAGQRQRLGIARALCVSPELIVADEPVSSLDASVQAQVINLLIELQRSLDLTYLFIAHDLQLVRHVSDRVAVMYLGRIVEEGSTQALFESPAHPYTRALHAATPRLDGPVPELSQTKGDNRPASTTGCEFFPRCPIASERCQRERPELREVADQQRAACHLAAVPE